MKVGKRVVSFLGHALFFSLWFFEENKPIPECDLVTALACLEKNLATHDPTGCVDHVLIDPSTLAEHILSCFG